MTFKVCAVLAASIAAGALATGGDYTDQVGPYLPWGIHMAYGSDPTTTMSFMWSTRSPVTGSYVHLGASSSNLNTSFLGVQTMFSDVNNTQYLHKVLTSGLQPGTTYYYAVDDGVGNASTVYHFTTYPAAPAVTTFAIFGDMGIDGNAHDTLPLLYADVASGAVDIILHIGDLAYDLDSNNGANGDAFVVNAQNYSAYIPTHYCPGNHESQGAEDFAQYIGRFNQMPGSNTGNSSYHSFNVGLTHILMYSSEAYFYFTPHGLPMLPAQYAWMEADLAAVDRTVTPWLITGAHRPMYCSPNDDLDDCHSASSIVRDGILGDYAGEILLYRYGVDMHFGAHEHSYERNYPVYAFAWNNVTGPQAYVNYDRTIHILTGAAGCPENQDPWGAGPNPFSALRLNVYGYGRLTVTNVTHAVWEFIDDASGDVVDAIDVIQTNHGPYNSGLEAMSQADRAAAYASAMASVRAGRPSTSASSTTATSHAMLRHAPKNAMPGHVHDASYAAAEMDTAMMKNIAAAGLKAKYGAV